MTPWKLADGRTIQLVTPKELAELPDDTALVCIDGTVAIKGKDAIDGDTRCGYLAFGLEEPPCPTD